MPEKLSRRKSQKPFLSNGQFLAKLSLYCMLMFESERLWCQCAFVISWRWKLQTTLLVLPQTPYPSTFHSPFRHFIHPFERPPRIPKASVCTFFFPVTTFLPILLRWLEYPRMLFPPSQQCISLILLLSNNSLIFHPLCSHHNHFSHHSSPLPDPGLQHLHLT